MKTLQKFAFVQASFYNQFSQEHHLVGQEEYRSRRSAALAECKTVMG